MLNINIAEADFSTMSLAEFRDAVTLRVYERKDELLKELAKCREDTHKQEALKAEYAKHGDRSENAEYQAAVDALTSLAVTQQRIETKLTAYNAYDPNRQKGACIDIGSAVKMVSTAGTFMLVLTPSDISDYKIGCISVDSPIGRELMGMSYKEGSDISITVNVSGTISKYNITEVLL